MTRKCFYDISEYNAPVVSGNCEFKMDCINQIPSLLNEENKFRNQTGNKELTSNDITIIDCMYSN